MKQMHFSRYALALALSVAALVSACGGGETSLTPAQAFAARITTDTPLAGRLQSASVGARLASPVVITNDQLFQWLQLQFPELLGTTAPTVIANLPYDVRGFQGGVYLAVANGRLYGLGPFTNGQLIDFGVIQQFADLVCSRINCNGSGTGGGTGALNGCTLPASEALRIGYSRAATYVRNELTAPTSTGEFTIETVVEGSATFEGQSAIRVPTRVHGVQSGQVVDTTVKAYQQIADNELTRWLGAETDVSVQGMALTVRSVDDPAQLNNEFTLALGASMDQTSTTTSTYVNAPFPFPPTTESSTTRITYEARETISVLGRSYDTCRYKYVPASGGGAFSYNWFIVGKGLSARQEMRNSAGDVLGNVELKSATINGVGI